jgi:hypothetical protein
MDIYIQNNGQQIGPHTIDQVNEQLAEGLLQLGDPAWHEGMDEWIPLSEITGVVDITTASPPPFDSTAFGQRKQPETIITTPPTVAPEVDPYATMQADLAPGAPVAPARAPGPQMDAAKTIHESDNTLISPKKLPAPKTAIVFGAFLTLLGAALMFGTFGFFKGPVLGMYTSVKVSNGLAMWSVIVFIGSAMLIFISIKFFFIVKVCSECGNRIPNHRRCPDCKATFKES